MKTVPIHIKYRNFATVRPIYPLCHVFYAIVVVCVKYTFIIRLQDDIKI